MVHNRWVKYHPSCCLGTWKDLQISFIYFKKIKNKRGKIKFLKQDSGSFRVKGSGVGAGCPGASAEPDVGSASGSTPAKSGIILLNQHYPPKHKNLGSFPPVSPSPAMKSMGREEAAHALRVRAAVQLFLSIIYCSRWNYSGPSL